MTRRKTSGSDPLLDVEREDSGRPLTRKQVIEMIRKKESFVEADFRGCDLVGIAFDGLDLSNAKFAEANLSRCSFKGTNLSGASFFGATLKDASLEEANLEAADFDYANLDGVTFKGARFRKALFPYKRLSAEQIRASIRTGEPVRMDASGLVDDD